MKKLLLASAIAAGLAVSSSAFAIGATPGFFVAGQLGYSSNKLWSETEAKDISSSDVTGLDNSHVSGGISGGYNFILAQKWLLGGQLDLLSLGSNQYTKTGASEKLALSAVNFLSSVSYTQQGFHVGPEAGFAIGLVNPKESGGGTSIDGNTVSKAVIVAGVNAGYQWNQFDFFVRYDHYFGHDFKSSDKKDTDFPAVDSILGGVAYTF